MLSVVFSCCYAECRYPEFSDTLLALAVDHATKTKTVSSPKWFVDKTWKWGNSPTWTPRSRSVLCFASKNFEEEEETFLQHLFLHFYSISKTRNEHLLRFILFHFSRKFITPIFCCFLSKRKREKFFFSSEREKKVLKTKYSLRSEAFKSRIIYLERCFQNKFDNLNVFE